MATLKWVFGKFLDIVVDVIAGIILYLILGGYISQPLSAIFPQLPTILIVALVLAVISGFSYRFYKSIRFHRFVEKATASLIDFLDRWDKLGNAFDTSVNAQNQEDRNQFEHIRAGLQYDYPKIASVVKINRYAYIDRFSGIMTQDYDVIGNLLLKSPFTGRAWDMTGFATREFEQQWDTGRTILVSTIGFLDCYRQSSIHSLYWILRLVPFPKKIVQRKS